MDKISSSRRSENMRRIRAKDTKPEMAVRRAAHAIGLRYRLHARNLPGRPDLVFAKRRLVIFVHGCFWHRHQGCRNCTTPKSRVEFWEKKFSANVRRDNEVTEKLSEEGWRVEVIWECEASRKTVLDKRLADIFDEAG